MKNNKISAVLGPTNTGKTFLAIETMLSFESGMIGFPLRLLAREVYDKIIKKVPVDRVALITGEEKIIPSNSKYFLCTVESMPKDKVVDMIKNHPFQNVYFNFLAGNNVEKKFEIDYWGLSNKQAFEYILENEEGKKINIGSAGPISLENSKKILNKEDRDRINITENNKADYIIDNYINWHGKYKKKRHEIPSNFEISDEITVGKIRILTIYKKNN